MDNLSGSHHQSQVICVTSVGGINTLVLRVIGERSRDVIGRLSVNLVFIVCEDCKQSPARFDASFVDLTSVHVLLSASLLFVSR